MHMSFPGVTDLSFDHTSKSRGSSNVGIGSAPLTCNFVIDDPSDGIKRIYGRRSVAEIL